MSIPSVRRNPRDIAEDIRVWMSASELTQQDVANLLDIQQPQVSRILKGQFGRRSEAVDRLCDHAGISQFTKDEATKAPSPAASGNKKSGLVSLMMNVWDGSPEDAERVSALLRAAANLRRTTLLSNSNAPAPRTRRASG